MYFVKSTLQNALFLHFSSKKFAYVRKKQYLCIVIKKQILTHKNNKNMYKTICKLMDGDSRLSYMDKKSENIWESDCHKTLDEAIACIKRHIEKYIASGMYFGSKVSDKSNYKIDGLNSYCELIAEPVLVPEKIERDDFFFSRTPAHYTSAYHYIITIEEKECDPDLISAKDELIETLRDLCNKKDAVIDWSHHSDDIIQVSIIKDVDIERYQWIEKENGKSERHDYMETEKHVYAYMHLYKIDGTMCVRLFFNHPYKCERKMPLDKNYTVAPTVTWYSPGSDENYPRKDTNYIFNEANCEKILKSLNKILSKTVYTLKDM